VTTTRRLAGAVRRAVRSSSGMQDRALRPRGGGRPTSGAHNGTSLL
jgi:hypothetical protein